MFSLVALLALGQLNPPMRFLEPNARKSLTVSAPFLFEFAPTSGTGMGTACACAAVTGSGGEAITFGRSSVAQCSTLGLATSGLTTTSMIECASGLPRVESDGTALGLRMERGSTNNLPRSEALDNAAWTSTATVTADQATSPKNTATGDQLSDVSGAALQGSLQAFVTGSLTKQSVSCYVRAGTLDKATISMTGTGNAAGDCSATVTGLNGTTWNRLSCSSAAAYAAGLTAVTLTVSVGTAAGDTGTIMAWGCQHELMLYPTSYIPTVAAAATRAVETATVVASTWPTNPVSMSAAVTTEWASADDATCCRTFLEGQIGSASGGFWHANSGWYRLQTLAGSGAMVQYAHSPTFTRGGTVTIGATNNAGGTSTLYVGHAIVAGPTATNSMASPWLTNTGIGYAPGTANAQLDGIISRFCISSSTARCVP